MIGVFARRFSSDGTPQSVEFQVNTVTVDEQDAPAVAAADDGDFVIAWASNSQDGFGHGVFARRFDSAGSALGVDFQVNTYTQAAQFHIAASAAADGDFVVAWQSYYQDGNYSGVFARRFDSAGSPQATEFQIHSSTAGFEDEPAVAHDDDGGFVIAWTSYPLVDFSQRDVFARRFDSAGAAQGERCLCSACPLYLQTLD